MALDKLVDSSQLDSDLNSVANAILDKSGGTGPIAFPSGFVSEIENIPSGGVATDGFEDVIFNFSSNFSVSMENNSLKNYSTASATNRAYFPLKKPISLKSGDVIKMTFTNKSGTTGYSQIYMQTIPFGDVALNNNFTFNTKILNNGITTTITQEYLEVRAFQIGPRHTAAWSGVNMELNIYINDVKIF